MNTAAAAVGALAAQRLAELRHARRNAAALRARGATEAGARHYPLIVALHVLWLTGTVAEGRRRGPVGKPAAAAFLAAQALRGWAIHTLGPQWTTRVLVDPDAPAVTGGPYRFLRHPNYIAVVVEIATFPLMVGARRTAALSSVANALLLRHRISVEDAARAGRVPVAARRVGAV